MSRARSSLGVALVVALAAFARPAAAEDKQAAQQLLSEGNALVNDGDYVSALEKFRAAYAAFSSPKILLNIGTTLRGLGRNAEAAEAYQRYLADPNKDPARVHDVEKILADVSKLVATLHVFVNEQGARILLDGKALDGYELGAPLRVDPGEHTVVVEKPGFAPTVKPLSTRAGDDVKLELKLHLPEVRTIVGPPSYAQRNTGLVVGALGVGSLGVGAVFGLLAKSKNDAASQHCEATVVCDPTGVALGQEAKSRATVSTVTLIAGGGLLATGAVILFTAPSHDKEPAPKAALSLSPSGLSIAGRF